MEAEFIQASKPLAPSSARKQNNEEIWLWIPLNHASFSGGLYKSKQSMEGFRKRRTSAFLLQYCTLFFQQTQWSVTLQKCPVLSCWFMFPHAISSKWNDYKNLNSSNFSIFYYKLKQVIEEVVKILQCLWSTWPLRSKLKVNWLQNVDKAFLKWT